MNRRSLLLWWVRGASLAAAAVVALPGIIHALSPILRRSRERRWLAVGPLEQFPPGQITEARVRLPDDDWHNKPRDRGVYVSRMNSQEVVVFSRACTDVGCPVNWDAGSGCFFCPCHGGIFSSSGERMAGPPPRPLHRYGSRVRDDVLEIDFHSLPPMT